MLHPSSSDNNETTSDDDVRQNLGGARPLEIDPSWRAGKKLEEARKQLGLSVKDVSDKIRVRAEYLESLEEMNVKQLPGKAYALAFLRSYARVLGLDENAIAEQFQEECALSREDAREQIRAPKSRPNAERPWLFAAVILSCALAFVAWRVVAGGQHGEVTAGGEIVSAQAESAQSADGASSAAEAREIEIRVLADEWLEARGPDGTVFLSRTLRAGDVYRPDPSPGWTLHAHDGGAFEVYVNGAPAGPLGPAGTPVLGRPIDEIEPTLSASAAR